MTTADIFNPDADPPIELGHERVSPVTIEALRDAVARHSYIAASFDDDDCPVIIDVQTANVLVLVYDALGAKHHESFERMLLNNYDLLTLVSFAWGRVTGRTR